MLYMVQGYIFLGIYQFVSLKVKDCDLKHLFFKSVVASYVIKVIFDLINKRFFSSTFIEGELSYIIGVLVLSIFLGYLCAIIAGTKTFNSLLLKLGVKRTTNQNIWDDIIRPNCWICMLSPTKEVQYIGQFRFGEDYKSV